MTKLKKKSESRGKRFASNKIAREAALKQFKRIGEATAVLSWREGRKRLVQNMNNEDAKKFNDSIEDNYPPDDELKKKLEIDRHHYEAFWDTRLSSQNLFNEGYGWLPECKGLVIGKEGTDPIVLVPESAEMTMFLAEDIVGYLSIDMTKFRNEIVCCFELNQCEVTELIPALHDQAVSRLMGFLSGEQISYLILIIAQRMEFPEFAGTDAMAKIVRNLNDKRKDDRLWRLGDYCIARISPIYEINKALIEHGGEEGKNVAGQLIEYMQTINSGLQETLDRLRGEKQ